MRRRVVLILVAALMAACQGGPPTAGGSPRPAPGKSVRPAGEPTPGAVTAVLAGVVRAPAGVIGQNGASVIGQNGAGVIGQNGANVIGPSGASLAAGRGLLALAEAPVAGAEVFLADAAGTPLSGFTVAKTDAEGRYRIPVAPTAGTFLVVARFAGKGGATARFETLAAGGPLGATADLGAASTLVTAVAAEAAGGPLGTYDPRAFAAAVALTTDKLEATTLPDFTDRQAVREAMLRLLGDVAELRTAVEGLRSDLARQEAKLDQLLAEIEALRRRAQERPSPSPTAGATAVPSPAASPAASPTPRFTGFGALRRLDAQLPATRQKAALAVAGGYVYVLGGVADGQRLDLVERAPILPNGDLGPVSGSGVETMKVARSDFACVRVGGYLYAIGGVDGPRSGLAYGTPTGSVERARIAADGTLGPFEVVAGAKLVTPRGDLAVVHAAGHLYVVGGGVDVAGSLGTVERAKVSDDGATIGPFEQLASTLATARFAPAVHVAGDRLLVVGGGAAGAGQVIEAATIGPDGALGPFEAAPAVFGGIPGYGLLVPFGPTLTFVRDGSVMRAADAGAPARPKVLPVDHLALDATGLPTAITPEDLPADGLNITNAAMAMGPNGVYILGIDPAFLQLSAGLYYLPFK